MGNGTITMTGAEYDALVGKIATLEAENAKLRAELERLRQQRDKLAGLLRDVRPIVALEVERWARAAILPVNANVESGLLTRIDAALAEVKP